MGSYVRNPKEPLPLFTQRPEGIREEKAFACGECGSVYSTKESAIYCCKQSVCEDCGNDCNKAWIKCSDCSDKIRLEKAIEIKDFDGPVYYEEADRYFSSYEEALDWFHDEPEDECPEYLFPCIENPCPKLDLDSALENLTEELFEDAYDHLKGVKELQIAVDEFNKKQTLTSWEADMKRKIRFLK
jgi:hypothetical protein